MEYKPSTILSVTASILSPRILPLLITISSPGWSQVKVYRRMVNLTLALKEKYTPGSLVPPSCCWTCHTVSLEVWPERDRTGNAHNHTRAWARPPQQRCLRPTFCSRAAQSFCSNFPGVFTWHPKSVRAVNRLWENSWPTLFSSVAVLW